VTKDTKLKIWVYGICWSVAILLGVAGLFVVGALDSTNFVHRDCPEATFYRSSYVRYEERTGEEEAAAIVCDRCEFEIKLVLKK